MRRDIGYVIGALSNSAIKKTRRFTFKEGKIEGYV